MEQTARTLADILGSIRVPTLVLHRPGNPEDVVGGAGPAEFVAERIRGARTVALGADGSSVFSREGVGAILEFLRGETPVVVPDAVLATVLFTDLVRSSELAASLGDRARRELLSRNHSDVRAELARYR